MNFIIFTEKTFTTPVINVFFFNRYGTKTDPKKPSILILKYFSCLFVS